MGSATGSPRPVKEQAASTNEQAAAVQETTATMEEINQSGNQIAERSRKVAASAEATSTATGQGLEALEAGAMVQIVEGEGAKGVQVKGSGNKTTLY